MNFAPRKKRCKRCGYEHDTMIKHCPKCGALNIDIDQNRCKTKIFWTSPAVQITLFFVGFIGFHILGLVISQVFLLASGIDASNLDIVQQFIGSLNISMSINSLSYLIVFIALFFVLYNYLNDLFGGFKKLAPWIIGIIGTIAITLLNFIYNAIVSIFYEFPPNLNESTIREMVMAFPVLSIVVFAIIGPFVEECTYRLGLMTLLNRFGRVLGFILTVIIFALIHFDFTSFSNPSALTVELVNLPTYIIGALILGIAYEQGGFAASFITHMFNNLLAFITIMIGGLIG